MSAEVGVDKLRVIEEPVVEAHPEQKMYTTLWRWGPSWEKDGREGCWVVERTSYQPRAIRVVLSEDVPQVEPSEFTSRLLDIAMGASAVDAALIALDKTPVKTVDVPATIAADLASLNERARRELEPMKYPAPAGLPPAGVWVRLHDRDDEPDGKWHVIKQWDGRRGALPTLCGHPRNIWPDPAYSDARLVERPDRPTIDACRHCSRIDGERREIEGR